jgi:hypothetical protein
MVSYGTGIQQKNCFPTTYHPSFMVRWWVLVYYGQFSPECKGLHSCNSVAILSTIFVTYKSLTLFFGSKNGMDDGDYGGSGLAYNCV